MHRFNIVNFNTTAAAHFDPCAKEFQACGAHLKVACAVLAIIDLIIAGIRVVFDAAFTDSVCDSGYFSCSRPWLLSWSLLRMLLVLILITGIFSLRPALMVPHLALSCARLLTGFLSVVFGNVFSAFMHGDRVPLDALSWSLIFLCYQCGNPNIFSILLLLAMNYLVQWFRLSMVVQGAVLSIGALLIIAAELYVLWKFVLCIKFIGLQITHKQHGFVPKVRNKGNAPADKTCSVSVIHPAAKL